MVFLAVVVGFVVAPLASVLVYGDATRRRLPSRTRTLWSAGVGVLSFAAFLVPYLYAGAFHRAYLQGLKPRPVVATPYEILLLHLSFGVLVSVVAVALYRVGSR